MTARAGPVTSATKVVEDSFLTHSGTASGRAIQPTSSGMKGLSGGQKVKVVLAAALWNNPQILFLDEPTNYLDRDSLGGLATAIRDWGGAVVIISHNQEFVSALCPEIWTVEAGKIQSKTKVGVAADAFLDQQEGASTPGASTPGATPAASRTASRLQSAAGTPNSSIPGTPVESDAEDDMSKLKGKKGKKKMTRNEKVSQQFVSRYCDLLEAVSGS